MYQDIESEIITQLQPIAANGIQTRTYPSKPSEWGEVAGEGWVALTWQSSQPIDDSYSLENFSGIESLSYLLDVRCKTLRTANTGLYSVLGDLKSLLWGFKPQRSIKPLVLGGFSFEGTAEGYWVASGSFMTEVFMGYSQRFYDQSELDTISTIVLLDNEGNPLPVPTP